MTGETGPTHDVAVVGGSFAGLVLARVAALRGLRVVVLDRRFGAGTRLHTTGILVREAADALDVPVALTRKIRRVRLYSPAMRARDLQAPGYYFLATDTAGLLEWLAASARDAGAELRYGVPFTAARRERGLLAITGTSIRARYLVGADGARSRVARCFDLARNHRFLVGLEAEFAGADRLEPGALHCLVDRALAPGYIGWAVPGMGVTQVGLACVHPQRPDLPGLLRKLAPMADLRGETPVGWRAGTIPVGGPLGACAAPGVMLVGDAAGWVSPLTGGGIANAFHYGRRAAQALSDHLIDGGPEPGAILAREVPAYWLKGLARRVASAFAPDWLSEMALAGAPGLVVARRVFFHRRAGASPTIRRAPSRPGSCRQEVRS